MDIGESIKKRRDGEGCNSGRREKGGGRRDEGGARIQESGGRTWTWT
jgi:hypothetical protein